MFLLPFDRTCSTLFLFREKRLFFSQSSRLTAAAAAAAAAVLTSFILPLHATLDALSQTGASLLMSDATRKKNV
jgi:hypothetical protein